MQLRCYRMQQILKNAKSKDLRPRCQLIHLTHYKKKSEWLPSNEVSSCNYFTMLCNSERLSSGNFWCTHSTLRVHMLRVHGESIKKFVRLKSLIKKFTIYHIEKKPEILSFEETRKGLTELLVYSDSEDLQYKIGN